MQPGRSLRHVVVASLVAAGAAMPPAAAEIIGVRGPAFALTAKADRITTPDGNSLLLWGFALVGRAQYPGPTLLVDQGEVVSISVTNQLPAEARQRVSLVFPGQEGVTAECTQPPCVQGAIALEAGPHGTVTYRFTAARPGTFHYTSGTQPDLQIEMGLVGALIVRPPVPTQAYGTPASAFDHEYLFLLSEMDSRIHDLVEHEGPDAVYRSRLLADYFPNYWFINGRNAPDTMSAAGTSVLPTQPYNALPRMHPGDRLLLRVIGGGHDLHPFHTHGNHARIIARDGHLLKSEPGDAIDLSHEVFTIQSVPGQTVDAIFEWTGKDLGWDIYGDPATPEFAHACVPDARGLDLVSREYCADHGKPFPVILPEQLSMTFGGFWSGSPFLGTLSLLPPGEGGMNPTAGFMHMWHSHTEKEITNFDIFPGGMMTMVIIEPIHVPIP